MHCFGRSARRSLGLAIAGIALLTSPGLAQQQDAAGTPDKTAVAPTAAERAAAQTLKDVREQLAKLLGLPIEDLKPDKDLVADLGVDRAILYYKLRRLYAKFDVKPPAEDLTVISQIADHVDSGDDSLAFSPGTATRAARGVRGNNVKHYVQKVYFATNRVKTGNSRPEKFFGSEPVSGQDQRLHYGLASVNIPTSHKIGRLESPLWGIRLLRNPTKHIYINESLTILDPAAFYASIKAEGEGVEPLLVYIHGFNVHFGDAIVRAAQIAVDLDFRGVPITFSWPSNGKVNPLAYWSDHDDVLVSVDDIERFLVALRAKFPDRTIHAIAHSMGAKALTSALHNIAKRGQQGRMFASVILAAPDLDARIFADPMAREIRPLAAHWAVYASENDFALNYAGALSGTPRLGVPLTVVEGMQIIDASKIEVTPWSVPQTHSYYATKKKVIDDMIGVLNGVLPAARGLDPKVLPGGAAWAFK